MADQKPNQKVLYWVLGAAAVIALAGLLFLDERTPTEEESTCEVTGEVVDAAGQPITSFQIAVDTPDKQPVRRDTVKGRHSFAFSAARGDYTITCTAQGYALHEAPFTAAPPSIQLKIVMTK